MLYGPVATNGRYLFALPLMTEDLDGKAITRGDAAVLAMFDPRSRLERDYAVSHTMLVHGYAPDDILRHTISQMHREINATIELRYPPLEAQSHA